MTDSVKKNSQVSIFFPFPLPASIFGGTFSRFRDTLSNYGITARFVDPIDLPALESV